MEKKIITEISNYLDISVSDFVQIKNGRNNKVFTICKKNKSYILKIFLNKQVKTRINREIEFINFLKKKNIFCVPKIIVKGKKYLLFNKIKGKKIKYINKNYFTDIGNFIVNLAAYKSNYKYFAIENGYNLKNYIYYTEKKIKNINNRSKKLFGILNQIRKKWNKTKKKILSKKNFFYFTPIISPSDFGLHNMIINKKKIFYFDFEYAGKDSLEKLICDLIANPNSKKKIFFYKKLIKDIQQKLNLNYNLYENCKILININYIRWSLIILGSFLDNKKKNQRSKSGFNENFTIQFKKSKEILNKILL